MFHSFLSIKGPEVLCLTMVDLYLDEIWLRQLFEGHITVVHPVSHLTQPWWKHKVKQPRHWEAI